MNKLKSSLAAKLIAVTLFVLLLMSLAVSVLDIAYIDSIDGYNYDYQTLLNQFKYDNSNDLNAVMSALDNGEAPEALNGRNGFYFVIRDCYTNKVVFDGLGKRDYVWATDTTLFALPPGTTSPRRMMPLQCLNRSFHPNRLRLPNRAYHPIRPCTPIRS